MKASDAMHSLLPAGLHQVVATISKLQVEMETYLEHFVMHSIMTICIVVYLNSHLQMYGSNCIFIG